MVIYHAVEHDVVQRQAGIRPFCSPPEPASSCFMQWSPQNRNSCFLEFCQFSGDVIYVPDDVVVFICSGYYCLPDIEGGVLGIEIVLSRFPPAWRMPVPLEGYQCLSFRLLIPIDEFFRGPVRIFPDGMSSTVPQVGVTFGVGGEIAHPQKRGLAGNIFQLREVVVGLARDHPVSELQFQHLIKSHRRGVSIWINQFLINIKRLSTSFKA